MNNQTVSDELVEHLRQYRHNDGSGFVFGYDKEGVEKLFAQLQRQREAVAQHEVGEAVPEHLDVRKIMLQVVPGNDGMGLEVFATCVADVEKALTEMGQQIENYKRERTAPPLPTRELLEKAIAECEKAKVIGTGSKAVDAVHNGAVDDCIKYIRALIPTEKEPDDKPATDIGVSGRYGF